MNLGGGMVDRSQQWHDRSRQSWHSDGAVVLFVQPEDEEISFFTTGRKGGNVEGLDSLLDQKGCVENSRLLASRYGRTKKLSEAQQGDGCMSQRYRPAKAGKMNVKEEK